LSRQRSIFARGFTLVELMIVVAIIGILASIAVPNFNQAILRARRSEAKLNINGIVTAEEAYHASFDMFQHADNNPGTSLTKQARDWDTTVYGWYELGYAPAGQVRCNYIVEQFGSSPIWYRASATCDVDDDNQTAYIRFYSHDGTTPGWVDLYPFRY
jgi:prepilin-type N-terminal cleavage/methylation domain-containing protein